MPRSAARLRLAVACMLAGLIAELSDLGRVYWAVFATVVVLNAPAALDRRRGLMRIGGTVAGFLLAIPIVAEIDHDPAIALALGMLLLLPGLLLMPINYGFAVMFITAAVGMLFTSSGDQADFIRYRVAENAIGVAVVLAVGLLLWRTRPADWWLLARRMRRALVSALRSSSPESHRDDLVTAALALRSETVEVESVPGATAAFAAAWTYVAAAENLARILVGPHAEPLDHRELLAARMEGARRRRHHRELARRAGDRPDGCRKHGAAAGHHGGSRAILAGAGDSNRRRKRARPCRSRAATLPLS